MDYCRVVGPRGLCTRSKGSQQTLRLSHPLRVARKPANPPRSLGVAPSDRPRRLRVPGICQPGAPRPLIGTLQTPKTAKNVCWRGRPLGPAQEAPGPWILPAWGPRPPWGVPPTPPIGQFSRKIGRVAPRTATGGPGSLDSASLGPQTPLGGTPHPEKCQKCVVWVVFGEKLAGSPLGPAQKALGPWNLPAWGPRPPWGYPPRPPKNLKPPQW